MKKYIGKIIAVAVIVVSLAFGAEQFKNGAVNYVPFAEAAKATDETVQIMGAPAAGTMHYDTSAHMLHFVLNDGDGSTMPVIYKGPKPDDLDTAAAKGTKITAQGSYDPSTHTFVAENLLVKCPSKYQGTNTGSERSYSSS